MKTCSRCNNEKELSEFYKNASNSKDGRRPECIECSLTKMKKWRAENPDKVKATYDKWIQEKAEHRAEYYKKWQDTHRSHRAAYRRNQRARYMGAEGVVTEVEWALMCKIHNDKCADCGKKRPLTMDHIVPLAKGGANTWDNIQPLCLPCNAKKGNANETDYRRPAKVYWEPNDGSEKRLIKEINPT